MTRHKVLVDAHRGASASHPENTLAAFRAALDVGADSVEFDVRLSRDGHPVVIHDDTVDRTTNGTGAVADLTLDQLRELDAGIWKQPEFAGERIPTLYETLEVLAEADRINMELKEADPRMIEAAVEAIETRRLHHRIMASSFHLELLVAIKRRLPGVWTHHFLEQPLPDEFWQSDARFINSLGLSSDHVTAEIVEGAHDRGKAVWVFTVDDPDDAIRLAEMGVQSITTNDPLTIIAALKDGGYR